MRRGRRKKRKEMPLSEVASWSVAGVLLTSVLFGGGWLYTAYKEQRQEAEWQAEQDRLWAERERSLAEWRGKEKQAQLEKERKAEEETGAALSILAEAKSLYMEIFEIRKSGLFQGAIYENWLTKFERLKNRPKAFTTHTLVQKGVSVGELYSMASEWRSNQGSDTAVTLHFVNAWDTAFSLKNGEELSHAESEMRTSAQETGQEIDPQIGAVGTWELDLPAIDSVSIVGNKESYKLTFRYFTVDEPVILPATEHEFKQGRKFVYRDGYEWLIVRPSGALELWDEEGLVSKGQPTN